LGRNKGLRNAFAWQISNVLVFSGLQLSYYAVLARLLSKSDFGIIAIANVFVNLAVLLSQIGLGPALIQRKDVSKIHISTTFYTSVFISIIIYAITYYTAGFFGRFYEVPILNDIIRLLTLSFVFSALGSTSLSLLQKRMKFNRLFYVEIGSAVIGMTIGIISALMGSGVWSLVYGTLSMQLTRITLAWIFSPINILVEPGKKELSELFHFGFGLTLVRINNFLSTSGLNFMLGKLLTIADLGVFERSYRIMMIPGKMLGNSIDRVMFPAMAKIQDEAERIKAFYEKNLTFALSLTLSASIWLAFYAKPVVLILLGPKWLDAVIPLRILFLVLPFRITVRMTDSFIRAKALVYASAFRKLLANLFLFGLVFFSVKYGLTAIALAILIVSIFQYFNMINLAKKYTGLSFNIYFKPFIDALPMALMMLIPAFVVNFSFNQFPLLNDQIITFAEPVITIIIFFIVLFLAAKKWPGMINPYISELVDKILRFIIHGKKQR